MAYEGGKMNFSVAFMPTAAFPLDARCYFETLAQAQAAAAQAGPAGSTDTRYYFGQVLAVVEGGAVSLHVVQPDGTLSELGAGGPGGVEAGAGLYWDGSGALCVRTTAEVAAGSEDPVTSGGVHAAIEAELGNVAVLLATV